MDDLSSLLSALQDEQAKQSSVRLSERNVVELVLKLKQLGLFGDELLHTINGKEYITKERLKADIEAALRQAGGRLELTELPALVGVDLVHCERQAALIVAESQGRVIDAQGELITTQYFDSLAAEVNDMLQESGVLSLADLAVTYALNTELLRSTIAARMGTAIAGQLEGGLLHTPAYVRNVKAQLRGALRGTAGPVALPVLLKAVGLDGWGAGSSSHAKLGHLVDELLAEGAVQGSTKGGGGSWVPTIHTSAQQSAISGFYRQNGWMSYELARKAGISAEKAYLGQQFPDGTPLSTVFVSPSIPEQAAAAVEDTLRDGTWLDVATVLPPALAAADVAALLDRCCAGLAKDREGKQGQVLATTCVVSAAVLAGAQEAVEGFAKQEAEKSLQGRGGGSKAGAPTGGGGGAASSESSSSSSRPPSSSGVGPGKGKADAGGGADSDDDWGMGKKGKKGSKAGGGGKAKAGGKAAAGGGSSGAAAPGGKPAKGGSIGPDVNTLLSVSVLTQVVRECCPDMDDAGPAGALCKAVAEAVRPAAVAAYQEALASVFTSGAVARKRAKEGALAALDEAFQLLQLYQSGCELLQADEATQAIMQRHLLRSTGMDALDALLSWCQHEFADQDLPAAAPAPSASAAAAAGAGRGQQQQGSSGGGGGLVAWTPPERAKLIKALPAEVGQPLARALEAAGGSDTQAFVSELGAAAHECGIRLKQLDKKAEKAALAAHRARLAALLQGEDGPAAVLALALPLLVMKTCSRAVSIPGRAIGGVLAMLQPQLEAQQHELLQAFHEGVVASLKAAPGGGAAAGEQQQQQQQQQQRLAAQVPQLKALAGVGGGSAAGPDAAAAAPAASSSGGEGTAGSSS